MRKMFKWRELYISYVNLSHRTDRRELMEAELKRVGLEAERFDAILTKDDSWNREPYKTMFRRTRGAIGCMLSQMAVMQKAYDMGKGAMVMEDDLIIGTDVLERLDYIENFINTKEPSADVIFLGGTVHIPGWWHTKDHEPQLRPYCKCNLQKDVERIDDDRMVRVFGMFSTHAYIVPYEKIPKILQLLNEVMHFSIGIDFSFIYHQPNLRCFAFLPGIMKQYNAVSDIGNGVTMFENFSKLNGTIENSAYWWQDKASNFDPNNFDWKNAIPNAWESNEMNKAILDFENNFNKQFFPL